VAGLTDLPRKFPTGPAPRPNPRRVLSQGGVGGEEEKEDALR